MVEKLDTGSLKYLIKYPDGYKKGDRCPTILFLHGAGTRGFTLDQLLTNSYFARTAKHKDFPFITVAPVCHEETWFDLLAEVKQLLRSIVSSDYADPSRVYIVGNSMGGYGTWQLAISCPELVAAIVPICGGGMYWDAARLKNVPVWAHHGALDTTVLPRESEAMVNTVNRAGGDARLTIYPDIAHPAWIPTYENYEVFEWLLSHKNNNALALVNEYEGAHQFG